MNTHIPPGDNGTKLMNAGILRTYEDRRNATRRSAPDFFRPRTGPPTRCPFRNRFPPSGLLPFSRKKKKKKYSRHALFSSFAVNK